MLASIRLGVAVEHRCRNNRLFLPVQTVLPPPVYASGGFLLSAMPHRTAIN
jgi:hypothetical protein